MNTTQTFTSSDASRRHDAREAFVRSIAKKHRAEVTGMTTEVELTWNGQPHLRFRIFKSYDGSEWLTIRHRARDSRDPIIRIAGLEYEFEGERENRTETLREALTWLASHYDREIEKMMEAGR